LNVLCNLEQKWNKNFSVTWIVFEFFQIVAVMVVSSETQKRGAEEGKHGRCGAA